MYYIDSAYDPLKGLHYDLNWNAFHKDKTTSANDDIAFHWNIQVPKSKAARESDSETSSEGEDQGHEGGSGNSSEEVSDSEGEPENDNEKSEGSSTPKRKRKLSDTYSDDFPSRRKRQRLAKPTPHSKAALKARKKFKIRPPTTLFQDNAALLAIEDDPFLRAMHTLHVGERPDSLPCRDEEYVSIFENILGLLQESSGGCICECR